MLKNRIFLLGLAAIFAPLLTSASGGPDPSMPVLITFALIWTTAKVFAEICTRIHVPSVVGELIAGIVLGVLAHVHPIFPDLAHDHTFDILARIGVVILLFEVGLESTVKEMMKVGVAAFIVACTGVIAPIVLGFAAGALLFPEAGWMIWLFIGTTMCATSVGITARVFQELNVSQTKEAKVVLGAAVIDDILGLVILAMVTGLVAALGSGQEFHVTQLAKIVMYSIGFLIGAVVIGGLLSKVVFRSASNMKVQNVFLPLSLAFCFILSYLAGMVGLATIVGAYAAGLVLEEVHFKIFREKGEHELEELIHPISVIFTPVFFVVTGSKVDASVFLDPATWIAGLTFSAVAVVSKLVAGYVLPKKSVNQLLIGLGMVPRGEVGLIFAAIGLTLQFNGEPLISKSIYSAIIFMIIFTTVLSPIGLKWVIARTKAKEEAAA